MVEYLGGWLHHIRREVLSASGDGIFGLVQCITFIRAVFEVDQDRETPRTYHRFDTLYPIDITQLILDIPYRHLVQVLCTRPAVGSRDRDLLQSDFGEKLLGDTLIGIHPQEKKKKEQYIIEPFIM